MESEEVTGGTSLIMKTATQAATMPLRVISFNIRYAAGESERVPGEHPWSVRGPKVAAQLRFITTGHDSPFICLQEVLQSQVDDVQAGLGPAWGHVGRGRGPGGPSDGEFSPVFYRRDRWDCKHSDTMWLSETPERSSRGWDAALNRIVTMGLFVHRATGARVVVMSTHLDHVGAVARRNSARMLLDLARRWGRAGAPLAAVLIAGDFNSRPDDAAYAVMTAPGSGVSDLSALVPEHGRYGNHLTYTSFGEPGEFPQRIDFLFLGENATTTVETFAVLPNSFDDQIRFSDHRPVVSDLRIRLVD